ncbi:hypothetical protein [Halalkalibacterium ligniniphilum]|uniref:hypothetical protein n=1 Tax=Halalkalibacterium ligniniphilum TaxID=1134413 RepID=UPI0003463E2E|nr:hypothetical protein [Halalkalibacterium ligniniphilum]
MSHHKPGQSSSFDDFNKYKLTPQQIAVITGLITNALKVQAVLVDSNQKVQIVLEGDLSKKGMLDEMMNDINDKRFGDVLNTFMKKK